MDYSTDAAYASSTYITGTPGDGEIDDLDKTFSEMVSWAFMAGKRMLKA